MAGHLEEHAVLVVLHDARVAVAVGDEDVALCVPADVGRAVEALARDARADHWRRRRLLTAASAARACRTGGRAAPFTGWRATRSSRCAWRSRRRRVAAARGLL